MADYEIFREQLAIMYPTYGHALWDPTPSRPDRPVQIGDVGFIRSGRFHRLFNALLSADDQPDGCRVPEYHEPLTPIWPDFNPSFLGRGHYPSVGIGVEQETDIHDTRPDDFREVSFKSPRKRRGAGLSLPVNAQREDTLAQGEFGGWMLKHIDRWFAFARQLRLGIDNMEDIILVTGCDRTRSWTNVAFLGSQYDAQASFGVRVVDSLIQFSHGRVEGAVLRQGPEGMDLPENQCIFVRGFRVARRALRILPRQLRAEGGRAPGPGGYDREPSRELVSISAITQYRDPLHLLLNYVAERAPDCEMILVHDDDLGMIDGMGDSASLETLQPGKVMDLLGTSNLTIYKFRFGLSPASHSPNTDAGVLTVATLSKIFRNWDHNANFRYLSASLPLTLPDSSSGTTRGDKSALGGDVLMQRSKPLQSTSVSPRISGERPPKYSQAPLPYPHSVGIGHGTPPQQLPASPVAATFPRALSGQSTNHTIHSWSPNYSPPPGPPGGSFSFPTPSDQFGRPGPGYPYPPPQSPPGFLSPGSPGPPPGPPGPPGLPHRPPSTPMGSYPESSLPFRGRGVPPPMGPPSPHPEPPPRPSIGHQYDGQGPHQQQSHFEYSQRTGRKIALCIGIDYLGQQAELRGCINDARNVERFLCESFGYKRDDIVVLTDDQHDPRAKPTRANIMDAMQWLVTTARPHDSLFFHYSGHGGTKNSNGDEVIYPMDFKRAGHIVGDQMHDIMVKPLPPGCRLTAIFDSCHSGSALGLPYIYSTEGKVEEPDLALGASQDLLGAASSYAGGDTGTVMKRVPGPVETATTGRGTEQRASQMNTSRADVISWSGCKDAQPSADAVEGWSATSAMSHAFIASLSRQPQQSYQQLLVSTHAILRAKYGQKPQLSSSHPIDTALQFIA